MTTPLAAKIAKEYGTPAAVIDMDRVEANIARIQAACDAADRSFPAPPAPCTFPFSRLVCRT